MLQKAYTDLIGAWTPTSCSNCVYDRYLELYVKVKNNISVMEDTNKFKLASGVLLQLGFGSSEFITASTCTDEKAIQVLKLKPKDIRFFTQYPDNWEELISEELISEELISEELISEELISEELISEELISEELISDELISDELISDELPTKATEVKTKTVDAEKRNPSLAKAVEVFKGYREMGVTRDQVIFHAKKDYDTIDGMPVTHKLIKEIFVMAGK